MKPTDAIHSEGMKKPMAEAGRQVAMVMEFNKCIGCQTCTIACKRLWTNDEGKDYMWWNIVCTSAELLGPEMAFAKRRFLVST